MLPSNDMKGMTQWGHGRWYRYVCCEAGWGCWWWTWWNSTPSEQVCLTLWIVVWCLCQTSWNMPLRCSCMIRSSSSCRGTWHWSSWPLLVPPTGGRSPSGLNELVQRTLCFQRVDTWPGPLQGRLIHGWRSGGNTAVIAFWSHAFWGRRCLWIQDVARGRCFLRRPAALS